MIKVASLDEYKKITERGKKRPECVSNCYFMLSAVEDMIRREKLYLKELPYGDLLLEREEGFDRCYYFLSAAQEIERVKLDQPAVIEYVFRSQLSEKQEKEIALIEKMGFALGRKSGRLCVEPANLKRLSNDWSEVVCVERQDADECLRLFRASFDPLYAFLPTRIDLLEAISQGCVLCVKEEGRIAGVIYFQTERNTAELRLLACRPEYRGRGIGKKLVESFHARCRGKVRQFFIWVDMENAGAVALYRKFGYDYDERRSNEYILK